ncbi:MAG: hypothetical protein IPK96_11980 [Flammeovirgaceae bacterium]|nr:hypothetical protein [Flammeovirgaceae bacterium]
MIIKNNSPLQNEEYPTFTISCNAGKPLEMYEDWPPIDRFNPASIRSQDNPMKILYYGKKIEETYKIGLRTIDLNRLNDKSNKLNIFLRFGGRYSPLKFSFYVVDTSFFTSMQYCELQSYPIPTEFIQSQENNLIADSDFDLDLISDWNTLSS